MIWFSIFDMSYDALTYSNNYKLNGPLSKETLDGLENNENLSDMNNGILKGYNKKSFISNKGHYKLFEPKSRILFINWHLNEKDNLVRKINKLWNNVNKRYITCSEFRYKIHKLNCKYNREYIVQDVQEKCNKLKEGLNKKYCNVIDEFIPSENWYSMTTSEFMDKMDEIKRRLEKINEIKNFFNNCKTLGNDIHEYIDMFISKYLINKDLFNIKADEFDQKITSISLQFMQSVSMYCKSEKIQVPEKIDNMLKFREEYFTHGDAQIPKIINNNMLDEHSVISNSSIYY